MCNWQIYDSARLDGIDILLVICHDTIPTGGREIAMCVRTLVGTETCEPVVVHNQSNRLQKAKEKYMKLHDDLVAKELEMIEQQKTQAVFIPELADDILRASTINYSSLLKALAKYYETVQQTKFFK